jgi:hypothetical protein
MGSRKVVRNIRTTAGIVWVTGRMDKGTFRQDYSKHSPQSQRCPNNFHK